VKPEKLLQLILSNIILHQLGIVVKDDGFVNTIKMAVNEKILQTTACNLIDTNCLKLLLKL